MIKIAALTPGKQTPSSRFRVRQHISRLNELNIAVREYPPAIDRCAPIPFWPEEISPKYVLPLYGLWQATKLVTRLPGLIESWSHDAVWLQRQILPGYFTLEAVLKKPLIFDVDDAIWLGNPFGKSSVRRTAERAEVVIAGNQYLANWFEPYARKVIIIPTAIDTERFLPMAAERDTEEGFIVGWIGTRGNLPYLEAIEGSLLRFLKHCPLAKLRVVADGPPEFQHIPADRLHFIPWSEDTEVSLIQSMIVGLMPLADDEWTRGKCSFKMLQYMACGLPTVVSPVGMNAEVLSSKGNCSLAASSPTDWVDALTYLYENQEDAKAMGRSARMLVEENFSHRVVVPQLASIFKAVV
jgi:glycosyltransferase involved in cell wall biosynthesis